MTTTEAPDSKHKQALDLATDGRHEQALAVLREHLLAHPADGEALNDAGALLYGLGRFEEAIRHLDMGLHQLPTRPAQTLGNLAEAYLAAGQPGETLGLFDELARAGALTADLANRTATAMLQADDRPNAMEALLCSMQVAGPEQRTALRPVLDKLRRLRPAIGFVWSPGEMTVSAGRMLRRLCGFLQQRFSLRAWSAGDPGELAEFLEGCGIAWLEGCGRQTALATRLPKTCRIVVHVRPHEAYRPTLEEVNWANVDLLVTSATRPVRDFLARRLSDFTQTGRIEHLPVGVDVRKLPQPARRAGKHLACIGNLGPRQNTTFLIQCFRRLHGLDPDYRLSFAGYFLDDALEAYLGGLLRDLDLREAVSFDGWQENLPAWLADKQFVVSAGILQPRDTSVLEAMAVGLQPVIHHFPGAEELYPEAALFRTEEEFCRRVLDGGGDPAAQRRFVEQRYGIEAFLARAGTLFVELEKRPLAPRTGEPVPQAADAGSEAR